MNIKAEQIDLIVNKLCDTYHPRQMYLYGSQAWGVSGPDSDIDIFVILDYSIDDMDDRIRKGIRALSGSGLDVDILVMTSEEVLARKDHPSTLVHKVLSQGIKLYDAA